MSSSRTVPCFEAVGHGDAVGPLQIQVVQPLDSPHQLGV